MWKTGVEISWIAFPFLWARQSTLRRRATPVELAFKAIMEMHPSQCETLHSPQTGRIMEES
jgi:hypothetical protein